MLAKAGPNGVPMATPSKTFIIFVFKRKEKLFGGYLKQITKIMLWDIEGILVAIVQAVNTNIDGFV